MEFNYALKYDDYSLSNALLWGNCCRHFKKASRGRLGNQIIHCLIGIAELIPVISQITSIFEMIIVRQFSHRPVSGTSVLPSPNRIQVDAGFRPPLLGLQTEEAFDKDEASLHGFKEKTLSELSTNIALQNQHPTYLRHKLEYTDDRNINPPTRLNKPPKEITFYATGATFCGYNAEGVRDYGWGCAWRAMQTCLSSYNIETPFDHLFHLFGPLQNLKRIYKDKYPHEDLTSLKEFAPYEIRSGWAEPFIGEMMMHFYGIPASLESVHGIPAHCHAPKAVFHNPSMKFGVFKERLETHFKSYNAAPVMMDDGTYALNIIGIGSNESHTTLWIADPHIGEGVNRALTEKTPNGLYTITLNANGEQIKCSLDEDDQHQKSNLFSAGSYRGLYFDKKPWMALFPGARE